MTERKGDHPKRIFRRERVLLEQEELLVAWEMMGHQSVVSGNRDLRARFRDFENALAALLEPKRKK